MQPTDVNDTVLPQVLRHIKFELGTLCRLICCSKSTADVVHASCSGSLKVQLPSHTALGRTKLRWLSKHAVLLRNLEYWGRSSNCPTESVVEPKKLAGALQKAAALPGGLMLRSVATCSLHVLQAASCSTLPHLSFGPSKDMLFPSVQETAAYITGLASQLRSLSLHADWLLFDSTDDSAQWCGGVRTYEPGCGLHSLLSQTLPQLTTLTRLQVAEVPHACIFKHAPPQLRQLCAVGVDDQSTDALEFGCLTALTLLEFKRSATYEEEGWRIIQAQDTLPPNLRVLRVTDCASATPLLRLTQLKELLIGNHCHMPAAELERLSVLTQLESAKLGCDMWRGGGGEREVEQGSAGWGSVPALKELELHQMMVDPGCDVLEHLAGLTGLSRLVWDGTFLCPDLDSLHVLRNWESFAPFFAGPPEVPDVIIVFRDGGMAALGEALPKSLREIEFGQFVPSIPAGSDGDGDGSSDDSDGDDGPAKVDEARVIYGLKSLQEAIAALPDLQTCRFAEQDLQGFTEKGRELVGMVLTMMQEGEDEDDCTYYAEFMETYLNDESDESGSEDGTGSEGGVRAGHASDAEAGSGDSEGGSNSAAEAGAEACEEADWAPGWCSIC